MKGKRGKTCATAALCALLCVPLTLGALAGCGGKKAGATEQTDKADSADVAFTGVASVVNEDSYAKNALDKEVDYLLSLDRDKLLFNFRENAGLDTGSASRYGGWENSLIAGHTMGHYLTAIAQAYANAGTSAADRSALRKQIDAIVKALEECQDVTYESSCETGAEEGFLWGANSTHPSSVEFQFDNVERGRTNIASEAWVPWYTMHKILAGLLDVYTLAGNETALKVAKGLGDWVYARVSQWNEATRKTVLSTEYGGMNDCLYTLYSLTGEKNYAVAAHAFDEDIPTQGTFGSKSMIDRILAEDENYLRGQHANTTIPKVIGLLNGYITARDANVAGVDTHTYLEVAEKFWTRVVEHHSYVTGGNSNDEHFQSDDSQWAIKSNINCETCNTYNMLKLSRMLFSLTKEKKYLDYYENTYINAILSSQNPETGMTMYFQPMAPGYFKVYSSEFDHFWCCTGSGMESMSKLNDSIYYTAGNATYVAMYMSSTYQSDGVELAMTADLETSDEVTIKVTKGETVLRLRLPDWTTKFELKVGENVIPTSGEEAFASVEVSKGDTVTLTLGKTVTVHTLPNANGVYAFKYGPFVLSAELGTDHTDQSADTEAHGVQVKKAKAASGIVTSYQTSNNSLSDFRNNIATYMTRGADGKFTLTGIEGGPLTYSLHYKQYQQRYAIYLTFLGEDGSQESAPTVEATEIESVIQPGRGQYEGGGFLEDNGSTGSDGEGRFAHADGSFSYWVGVDKAASDSNYIMTALAKADNGKTLKLSAGGKVFYEKKLNYTGTDDIYDVYIPIPASVVNGAESKTLGAAGSESTKDRVKITVTGAAGETSAALHTYFKTVKIAGGAHDESIAYFVDCGDYDPSTLSAGDRFGMMNSVTEQAYGFDPVTGRMWGVWDEAASDTWRGGAPIAGSVATNSTWAQENQNPAVEDGAAKTATNRYTKNQFEENWQTLKIGYKFELPDGNYTVKLYFSDPWGCSKHADVAANGRSRLTDVACGTEVSFSVTVSGGELLLEITNPVNTSANDLCINLCYIVIAFA